MDSPFDGLPLQASNPRATVATMRRIAMQSVLQPRLSFDARDIVVVSAPCSFLSDRTDRAQIFKLFRRKFSPTAQIDDFATCLAAPAAGARCQTLRCLPCRCESRTMR